MNRSDTEAVPERKWQMIRLSSGDYLLPSNDRSTMFRISSYEDGPSYGIVEGMTRDQTFWRVTRWPGPPESVDDFAIEYGDQWIYIADGLDTRREAIYAAMQWEATR